MKNKCTKNIRLIELFGGIGSQAMALKRLGVDFEHYRLVEFDKFPVASYNAIHNTNFKPTDITEIKGSDLGIVDTDKYTYLLTYSFPCQDLSTAGKQAGMKKGSGTRSGLLWEVERLLNECENLPSLLLMENVTQVHNKKNMPDFEKWVTFLESKGYSNFYQDLNAKDYGVPQSRNRCFMVSILNGKKDFEFPKPKPLDIFLKDLLDDEVDEKFYLKDYQIENIKKSKFNTNKNRIQRKDYCDTLCARDWKDPKCVQEKDLRIRKLTPKEYWRLMGFKDESFEKAERVNSNTQLYKQAGNSIVVDVLMAIFDNLLEYIHYDTKVERRDGHENNFNR
jgi:DNA (cytosine-5)-methyltransferase 1